MAYKPQIVDSLDGGTGISNASTITLGGAINTANSFTTSGNFALTLTQTGITNVTLPTSGTLATTSQIPSTPISLANGGTAASLAASNGGILYSGASAFAVLSGTATANKVLMSGSSAAPTWSTPTFPNASATSGKFIQSDGTNWIASTPTIPATAGTSGKILISDGTNFISSTPTFPNASATSGKVIKSDGTNWVASTETYAAPGTSGNVLTSDGTNWTSSTPTPIWLTASGTLTNAQIKALHATPVQLIAAPGAGKVINVVQMTGKLSYGGTNVFTAGAAQSIQAYYGTAISVANILNNAGVIASSSQYSVQGGQYNSSAYASIANVAINAYNPVATEITGNAANDNTVPWFIVYYIVTI